MTEACSITAGRTHRQQAIAILIVSTVTGVRETCALGCPHTGLSMYRQAREDASRNWSVGDLVIPQF